MGWFVAAFFFAVALVMAWALRRQHRRRLAQLRAEHRKKLEHQHHDHNQQVARLRRDHDRQLRFAHHPLAEDLLPGLDGLMEARRHIEEHHGDDDDPIAQGLEAAHRAIVDALSRHGIEPIAPERGEPFEPALHEAISRHHDPDVDRHRITRCFRQGYRDGDRVLRHAMVEVSMGPSESDASAEPPPHSQSQPDHEAVADPSSPPAPEEGADDS